MVNNITICYCVVLCLGVTDSLYCQDLIGLFGFYWWFVEHNTLDEVFVMWKH